MNYQTLERYAVADLVRGYSEEGGEATCLWCGAKMKASRMPAHLQEEHPEESRLEVLLGADALNGLSPGDKELCRRIFRGEELKAIAPALKKKYNSLRAQRSRLYRQEYIRAKLMLMLLEPVFAKKPMRAYRQEEETADEAQPMPYFLHPESREIVGFAANKEALHDRDHASYWHATTLILVVKVQRDGEILYLACDKGAYTDARHRDAEGKHAYDCLGGHMEKSDVADVVDATAYEKCARRELVEELHLRSATVDPERLLYVAEMRYEGESNREVSRVYVYVAPLEVDARVREVYADSLNMEVVREYPIRYFTAEELSGLADTPGELSDGLGRIAERIKQDGAFAARIAKLVKGERDDG